MEKSQKFQIFSRFPLLTIQFFNYAASSGNIPSQLVNILFQRKEKKKHYCAYSCLATNQCHWQYRNANNFPYKQIS